MVLKNGAMPLWMLQKNAEVWIAEEKGPSPPKS
jgi:hypothetical protein